MPFLTPQQIEKQQSESEGYEQGPQPKINNPNANTQANLGNPVVQTPEPAPYYPGATETPNLQLSLTNMGVNLAENFVLLDGIFPAGGPNSPPTSVSGNYTALISDRVILDNASGTVHLNSALPAGTTFTIKNTSVNGTLIVLPTSGLIDGQASFSMTSGFGNLPSIDVVFDGTNWWIL
jgi:hypothetical protein